MKKLTLGLLSLVASVLACSGSCGQDSGPLGPVPTGTPVLVTLLHFSDYHSHAVPYFSEHAADQGGIARTLAYVQKRKTELANVLVLNGGDMWNSGTPAWSDKYHADCTELRWLSDHLGAMAFGNHDADYGWDALIACRAKVKFPILSANLVDKDEKLLLTDGGKPYVVLQSGGARIGAFAVAGTDFARLVLATNLPAGAHFTDPVAAAQKIVQTLREVEKVDAVVLFGHQDRESDYALAKAVPGIDLILGTHSHYKGVLQQIAGTQTYFISPFQYLNYLSEVELTIQDHKVAAVHGTLVKMDAAQPQDPTVAVDVTRMQAELEKDPMYAARFQPIGSAQVELDNGGIDSGESVLGNFAMDVVRVAAKAHAAFSSASSFRASIPPLPAQIRMEDYLTALPYTNRILTVELTGVQLQALLDFSASKRGSDNFGVTSGVRYTLSGGHAIAISVVTDPTAKPPTYEPLQPARVYKVMTTDYLATKAAGYLDLFAPGQNKTDTTLLVNDTIIAEIKAHSPVSAKLEGRVTILDGPATVRAPAAANKAGKK